MRVIERKKQRKQRFIFYTGKRRDRENSLNTKKYARQK